MTSVSVKKFFQSSLDLVLYPVRMILFAVIILSAGLSIAWLAISIVLIVTSATAVLVFCLAILTPVLLIGVLMFLVYWSICSEESKEKIIKSFKM